MSKWIQKANIKKGALHKELGVKEDERIPQKKLKKAAEAKDRKSTRLNSSHIPLSRMPSSA